MNTKPPCRDCTHRSAECHAKCEPYKEYETRHAEELKERTRQKLEHLRASDVHIAGMKRMQRGKSYGNTSR